MKKFWPFLILVLVIPALALAATGTTGTSNPSPMTVTDNGNADDFFVVEDSSGNDYFAVDDDGKITSTAINFATSAAITGSIHDYGLTLDPPLAAYNDGTPIWFRAHVANVGSCNVNVNSLGFKRLVTPYNVTPPENYIEAGSIVHAVYDGSAGDRFQILTPDANP